MNLEGEVKGQGDQHALQHRVRWRVKNTNPNSVMARIKKGACFIMETLLLSGGAASFARQSRVTLGCA